MTPPPQSELQIFLRLTGCVYKQNHTYESFKVFSAPKKVLQASCEDAPGIGALHFI